MGRLRSMLAVVVLLGLAAGALAGDRAPDVPPTRSAAPPSPASAPTTAAARPVIPATQPAAVVQLFGVVDESSRAALFRHFAAAKAAGATTIILEENTPGGLVTAALDITRFLRSQNDVRTVAFV